MILHSAVKIKFFQKKEQTFENPLTYGAYCGSINEMQGKLGRGGRMYQVLDICRYVINYSNERNYGVSNLKLQKILYFIQAYFLINSENKEPCFAERIEAWDLGPVVPEAYREYKQYGSGDIPSITTYFQFKAGNSWEPERVEYEGSLVADKDCKLINEVVDKFADYAASDLVKLTHNQAPWKDAYARSQNNEITIRAIRDYFNE